MPHSMSRSCRLANAIIGCSHRRPIRHRPPSRLENQQVNFTSVVRHAVYRTRQVLTQAQRRRRLVCCDTTPVIVLVTSWYRQTPLFIIWYSTFITLRHLFATPSFILFHYYHFVSIVSRHFITPCEPSYPAPLLFRHSLFVVDYLFIIFTPLARYMTEKSAPSTLLHCCHDELF